MQEPQRRQDPLALAVLGVAVVVIVTAGLYLVFSIRSGPQPAKNAQVEEPLGDAIRRMIKSIESAIEGERKPPPVARPAPPAPKSAPPVAVAKSPAPVPQPPQAGRSWRYQVTVEPALWRDATLTYRTVEMVNGLAVYTEFRHAGGQMNFQLGTFAPKHPSHANMRFPGFFMHAAYLDKPLEVGQRFTWEWPWQLPDGGVRAGRVKRYVGEVKEWENTPAPIGTYVAARIETTLSYIEDGRVQASAKETLWYSPRFSQVVKVVREGKTPDEGTQRIVAELVELR